MVSLSCHDSARSILRVLYLCGRLPLRPVELSEWTEVLDETSSTPRRAAPDLTTSRA